MESRYRNFTEFSVDFNRLELIDAGAMPLVERLSEAAKIEPIREAATLAFNNLRVPGEFSGIFL